MADLLKGKTGILKVIINCSTSFDVDSFVLSKFLDSLKEVHVTHDEFKGENEVLEVTHVINVFSNVLDLSSLCETLVQLLCLQMPQGYERGFFHFKDCCVRVYAEERVTFLPLEIVTNP